MLKSTSASTWKVKSTDNTIKNIYKIIFLLTLFQDYENLNGLKLVLYVIAKFASTVAYSSVILHAPEIFPTHLR